MFEKRAWNVAASILVVGVLLGLFFARGQRPDFSDFSVYWIAGGKAARHQTVYDVQGHYQYKYSPFVALLWSLPAALLPGGKYGWKWLHYLVCCVSWYALWFGFARALDRRHAFVWWCVLALVFSVGLRDELKLGQANLWPFLLVLPAWFVGRRERGARGFDALGFAIGAAWGLAIQWKLYALVLGPIWLLRGRPQVFVGAIAMTALTLFGIQSAAHGGSFALAENARWLQSLTASSQELLVSKYNVSLLGILGKLARSFGAPLGVWAYAVWLVVALAWLAGLVWAERAAAARGTMFSIFWSASWAWAGIVVLNPLVWPYWLVCCVPLFLAYAIDATREGVARAGALFFAVSALFSAMNWLQNFGIVHLGGSLVATLALGVDAFRRARTRDLRAPNARLSPAPASLH